MSGYFRCVCCGVDDIRSETDDPSLCEVCEHVGCSESGDSPECRTCLIDGARGIYLPRDFVDGFDLALWNVSEENAAILRAGPEGEAYWETWDDMVGYGGAWCVDSRGVRWELECDGDLFARAVSVPSKGASNV